MTKSKNPVIEIVENSMFDSVVADEIISSISEIISEKGSCLFALAGGSTPGSVYRVLSVPPRSDNVDWSNVTLCLGDERCVPKDHAHSNYKMVKETLVDHLSGSLPKFVDLQEFKPELNSAGFPEFDLMLLGVGEDGHTASLFPNSEILKIFLLGKKSPSWNVSAENPHDKSARVSIAPEVIFLAKRVIFLVRGAGKAQVIHDVLKGKEDILNLPSQLYRRSSGAVIFFIDSTAATQLDA